MNKVLHQLLFTVFLLSAFPGLGGGTEEKNERAKVPIVTPALVAPETDAEFMQVTNLVADERTDARKAFSTLDAQSQYVEGDLTYDDLVTLPVGIRKKIGENTIEMAVAKAVFLSDKAELTVYIRMTIPVADVNTGTTERVLYFGADQVGITRNGGLTGDFRAVLLGDFVLPFRNYSIILRGGGGLAANGQVAGKLTYAEFTCGSGFEEARLVADVVFPREVFIPLDKNQNYQETSGRVLGHFDFMSDKGLHNVFINVSFGSTVSPSSAFAIKGVDRFAFELQNLSIDLSDSLNPSNFVSAIDFPHTASPSWRGVYIENFTVVLPPEFRKKGSEERIAIYAHNVMVDRLGFSGKIGVGSPGNLPLTLEEGDASGWRFAVDRVELDIFGNKLRGGRFAGRIALPVSSEDNQALAYEGAIEPGGNYRLAISNLEQVDFSFMRAKAVISPGSRVVLDVINGRFKPKAVLHGSMGIYANLNDTQANTVSENGDNILAFKGITFENLVLQTDAPRLTFGKIGYEQSGKMALFPVVIESFSLLQTASPEQNRIEVGIGVSVNLMNNNSGKGFSGSTMVTFVAEENPDGRWKFKGLKKPIDIFLAANISAFSLNGSIQLYDNETEKGFEGSIGLKIAKPEIDVCSRAKFGYNKIDNERYWYVDAMVAGLNVPVVGPLLMEGFAGGAYSKFRPDPPFNATTIANMECNPNAPTSIPYTYDKTVGLGFKAAIMLKTTGDGFRGRVGFEIVLNRSYGVSSISFYGRGELSAKIPTDRIAGVGNQLANNLRNVANSSPAVSSIVSSADEVRKKGKQVDDNPGSAPEGNIAFWFGMLWDFENDVMHGEAEAYINIGNVLVGNGPNGRMGWMSMHFAPNSWYIHAGNPQDRLGLKVQIGPVRAQVSSYVMMGHGIPTQLPLPPAQVVNLLNLNTSSSAFQRSTADRDSLTTGSGFALGFDLSIDTGPQQFAMFYGQFGVGAGIDMLLLKRNGISVCGTDAGSNGFYALGQFYAYLQAEVGIRVRQKKFEILSAGVAALMQGGMPNPAWMSGHVGGKFRIFGIKRNFDFNVRLGNECSGI